MSAQTKSSTFAAPATRARGDDAAGRTGAEHGDRAAHDVLRGHDAAVGLHDQQLVLVAAGTQPLDEPAEVALDLRRHVGVDQRRAGALELRRRRHDLVRQRDADTGAFLLGDLAHALLVLRVDEREHEDDRQRLEAELLQAPQRGAHGGFVERHDDLAFVVEPFGNADAPAALRDRRRRRQRRVPDVFLVAAAQLDLVAMALRGDQPGHRAAHLDHRVVGGGRAVHDDRGLRQQLARASGARRAPAARCRSCTPSD